MFYSSIPDFLYPDFKVAGKFKLSKNLFRRVRARDSFNAVFASSQPYLIREGETADSIAFNAYGDSEYFWTILLLNNITNLNTEWPLSSDEMDVYIQNTYGDNADKPRHWETSEIKDTNVETNKLDVILEGGNVVEMFTDSTEQNQPGYYPKVFNQEANGGNGAFETWTFKYRNVTSWTSQNTPASWDDITVTAAQNLVKVTNREYEYELNELKKSIYLPTTRAISIMESEIKSLLDYDTKYKITDQGYRLSEI